MSCEVACGDCSNDCGDRGDRLVDIEDYEAELKKLRARTKELEETMAKIKNDEATKPKPQTKLRSSDWFNRKSDLGMTALYVERYLNSGLTREELMSNKPIVGIAQSGSDIAPVRSLLSLFVSFFFFFFFLFFTLFFWPSFLPISVLSSRLASYHTVQELS